MEKNKWFVWNYLQNEGFYDIFNYRKVAITTNFLTED